MRDLIDRQAAIDALCAVCGKSCDESEFVYNAPQDEQVILCPEHYCLCTLPSAQPEPAIPLQWIEAQIEWLKSLDNDFSTLTALQISAMVNKWKGEQDG